MKSISACRSRGFTIVELIVVISVIGILASISLVVYSGVQARAQKTKVVSTVQAFKGALELHKIKEGTYPMPWMGTYSYCLGTGYTEHQNISGSGQPDCRWGSWGEINTSAAFNSAIAKYGAPNDTQIEQKIQGSSSDGVVGMYYDHNAPTNLDGSPQKHWIVYVVPDKTCGLIVPVITSWPNLTSKSDDAVSEHFGTGGLCFVPLR